MNQILKRQTSPFHYGSKFPAAMFFIMINFKRLFFSGLLFIVLQTQQSIKHSLMFTFQFSYFTIYILAQQSADVEPVSGTSEVGPITFQGDVSTILQESDESGTIKILYISMMYLYTEFPDFNTNI